MLAVLSQVIGILKYSWKTGIDRSSSNHSVNLKKMVSTIAQFYLFFKKYAVIVCFLLQIAHYFLLTPTPYRTSSFRRWPKQVEAIEQTLLQLTHAYLGIQPLVILLLLASVQECLSHWHTRAPVKI